jgi:hypothetical protein
LDSRYRTQANLIGFLYLFDIFIGSTLHWLEFFLHYQGFTSLDISFLLKGLDGIG